VSASGWISCPVGVWTRVYAGTCFRGWVGLVAAGGLATVDWRFSSAWPPWYAAGTGLIVTSSVAPPPDALSAALGWTPLFVPSTQFVEVYLNPPSGSSPGISSSGV
jgi:hypothetical protein